MLNNMNEGQTSVCNDIVLKSYLNMYAKHSEIVKRSDHSQNIFQCNVVLQMLCGIYLDPVTFEDRNKNITCSLRQYSTRMFSRWHQIDIVPQLWK